MNFKLYPGRTAKQILSVCGVIFGLGLASVSDALHARDNQDTPIRLSADLDLTAGQQAQLADEAMKGSPEAARSLTNFHFIVRGDRDATIKWATIGAENGDGGCAYQLYILLHGSPDHDERRRSLFWLHKAADEELEAAKDELKALEKKPASPSPGE